MPTRARSVVPYAALLGFLLMVLVAMTAHPSVGAQTSDGAVRLLPSLSTVDLDDGPFTVFVAVDGLEHHGTLQYDDDRDTVPDREVESLGLAAFEFAIAYDADMLEVVEIVPALAGLERTGRQFQCLDLRRDIGLVSFACVSTGPEPPGAQGTLTLASVVLRPLGAGASPLLLEAEIAGPLGTAAASLDISSGIARVRGGPSKGAETATETSSRPLDGTQGTTGLREDRTTATPAVRLPAAEGAEEREVRGILDDGQAEGSSDAPAAAEAAPEGAETTSNASGGPFGALFWGFAIAGMLITLGLTGGATMWLRRR